MAFENLHVGFTRHGTEHRHVGVMLYDGTQLGFMAAAAELVEDHAADADLGVETLIAQYQRCDAARHAACVQHQYHGRIEQLGQRRIAVAAVQIQTVVESLVALDDVDVRAPCVVADGVNDFVVLHGVEIEVVAGASGGPAEPHGIDVVRPLLERLHHQAARAQGSTQSQRDSGLAGRLVGSGDEDLRHGYSQPVLTAKDAKEREGYKSDNRSWASRLLVCPKIAAL